MHLYETSRMGQSLRTGSRLVDTRGQGAGWAVTTKGNSVSFWRNENVLEADSTVKVLNVPEWLALK